MVSPNENTPLVPNQPTPLPWSQISIILLAQVSEPVSSQSIYPYINQLVSELDIIKGDKRKVGYYAGLIQSLFFVVQASTVLQWGRLSDRIGRKPVMLVGLFGLIFSMLSFGLSRTFWALVVSRCLCGLLNGNSGVIRSVMGELTDPTNRAEASALMPVVWGVGSTLGPLLGGGLSKPANRFPNLFGSTFWKEYPYFLPCVATASFTFLNFVLMLVFFKETLPKRTRQQPLEPSASRRKEDSSLREICTSSVILSIANYMCLGFLNSCVLTLIPLFFAMPLSVGGLGFDPATIGYTMGYFGIFGGIFQALFLARIIRCMGEKGVFVTAMLCFLPTFALFPVMNRLAQQYGPSSAAVWICIAAMLPLLISAGMGYGSIFLYITSSAPNRRLLGATNGLAQTTISISRAIGPSLASSLFSLSVQRNLLRGYAVYAILFALSCCAVMLSLRLPTQAWPEPADELGDVAP